ncbi:hypothetical protein Tsubulata_000669 [Turnera subulata]|uniref:CCHC-type domain-containing protein n=1 Tax=Turnera subulata TaxID=218843 RepID=A0A9Q0J675_9ROSI|nr:hypothetical protein Tsubulata_000669 [Turnera subulata]
MAPPGKPPDPSPQAIDIEIEEAASPIGHDGCASEGHDSDMRCEGPSFLETLMKNQAQAKARCTPVDLIEEQLVRLEFVDGDRLRPAFGLDATYYQRWSLLMEIACARPLGWMLHIINASVSLGRTRLSYVFWANPLDSDHIVKTMAWVRLPGLPLMYYDDDLLSTFATAIGTPVRIDSNTSQATRALYARMCVEVDLSQPLVPLVSIQDEVFKVQYEGLHTICLNCGRFGHKTVHCQFDTPDVPIAPAESVEPETAMDLQNHGVGSQVVMRVSESSASAKRAHFGEWMMVSRPPRRVSQQRAAMGGTLGSSPTTGNRFSALETDEVVFLSSFFGSCSGSSPSPLPYCPPSVPSSPLVAAPSSTRVPPLVPSRTSLVPPVSLVSATGSLMVGSLPVTDSGGVAPFNPTPISDQSKSAEPPDPGSMLETVHHVASVDDGLVMAMDTSGLVGGHGPPVF